MTSRLLEKEKSFKVSTHLNGFLSLKAEIRFGWCSILLTSSSNNIPTPRCPGMEQELERVKRLLDQSEDSRESLVQQVCIYFLWMNCALREYDTENLESPTLEYPSVFVPCVRDDSQVENMRGELQRSRKEKTELQRVWLQPSQPIPGNYTSREEGRLQGTHC